MTGSTYIVGKYRRRKIRRKGSSRCYYNNRFASGFDTFVFLISYVELPPVDQKCRSYVFISLLHGIPCAVVCSIQQERVMPSDSSRQIGATLTVISRTRVDRGSNIWGKKAPLAHAENYYHSNISHTTRLSAGVTVLPEVWRVTPSRSPSGEP